MAEDKQDTSQRRQMHLPKWPSVIVIGICVGILGFLFEDMEIQNNQREPENFTEEVKFVMKDTEDGLEDIKVATSEDNKSVFVQAKLSSFYINNYHYVEAHVENYLEAGKILFKSKGVEEFELLYFMEKTGKEGMTPGVRTTMTADQYNEFNWDNMQSDIIVSGIRDVTGNFRQSVAEFRKYENYQTAGVKESINQDKGVFIFPIIAKDIESYDKLNIFLERW